MKAITRKNCEAWIVAWNVVCLFFVAGCNNSDKIEATSNSDIPYVEWHERQHAAFGLLKKVYNYNIYVPDRRLPASEVIYWQRKALNVVDCDHSLSNEVRNMRIGEWKEIQIEAIRCLDRFMKVESRCDALSAEKLLDLQETMIRDLYRTTNNDVFKP